MLRGVFVIPKPKLYRTILLDGIGNLFAAVANGQGLEYWEVTVPSRARWYDIREVCTRLGGCGEETGV
jgi:hypothetical protein